MKFDRTAKSLDELTTDLLIATLFDTERPPKGIIGLVDWRLNGFISKTILSGGIEGKSNEMILLPLHARLPARRLLLVGLGAREEFTLFQARHLAHRLGRVIKNIGAMDAALYIPPAHDEKESGETERVVMDMFKTAQLPDGLLLRWLSPPTEDRPPAFPEIQNGLGHSTEAHA